MLHPPLVSNFQPPRFLPSSFLNIMSKSEQVVPGSYRLRRAIDKFKQCSSHLGKRINDTEAYALESCDPFGPSPSSDFQPELVPSKGPRTDLRSLQSVDREHSRPMSTKAIQPTIRTRTSQSRIPAPTYQPKRYARCSERYLPIESPSVDVDQNFYSLPHPQVNVQDPYLYALAECHSIIMRLDDELGKYPQRPAFLLQSSTSVDALRRVLEHAPTSLDDPLMEVSYDKLGTSIYSWGDKYMNQLFQALIRVIKDHGVGMAGWRSIRWEVYDKVRSWLYL